VKIHVPGNFELNNAYPTNDHEPCGVGKGLKGCVERDVEGGSVEGGVEGNVEGGVEGAMESGMEVSMEEQTRRVFVSEHEQLFS